MLQQALAFLCGCLGGAIWAKKGHEGRDKEQGASFCFEGRVLTLEKVLKTTAVFPCIGSKTEDANRLLKPEFRWPVSDRWPDLEFRFLMISTVLFPRFYTSLGQLQLCIEEMSFAWWEENEGGRSWSGLPWGRWGVLATDARPWEWSREDRGRGMPPGTADQLHKFVETQLFLYLRPQ